MPKITPVPKKYNYSITLPKINSSHLQIGHPKRKLVFKPSIFRCENVSFREGNAQKNGCLGFVFVGVLFTFFTVVNHHQWNLPAALGEYETHFFHPPHHGESQIWGCLDPWKVKMIKFSTSPRFIYIHPVKVDGLLAQKRLKKVRGHDEPRRIWVASHLLSTRWAPTSYKWDYNPTYWGYKTPVSHV